MSRPYKIIGGEIVENRMSFDMTTEYLNNVKTTQTTPIRIEEATTKKEKYVECQCGVKFKLGGSGVDICNDCFEKYDNMAHYLFVKERSERLNK